MADDRMEELAAQLAAAGNLPQKSALELLRRAYRLGAEDQRKRDAAENARLRAENADLDAALDACNAPPAPE